MCTANTLAKSALAVATVLVVLTTCSTWGQVLYGTIIGNVRDASGAAIPGASVTITNKETNQVRTTVTNDEGGYSVPTVQSGTYEVKATKEGFRPTLEDSVAVTINSVSRVDFSLAGRQRLGDRRSFRAGSDLANGSRRSPGGNHDQDTDRHSGPWSAKLPGAVRYRSRYYATGHAALGRLQPFAVNVV